MPRNNVKPVPDLATQLATANQRLTTAKKENSTLKRQVKRLQDKIMVLTLEVDRLNKQVSDAKPVSKPKKVAELENYVEEFREIIRHQEEEIQLLESGSTESRIYKVLKAQLKEEQESNARLESHIKLLRSDRDDLRQQIITQSQTSSNRGRPRKITPEQRQEAQHLKAKGYSIRKIAELLNISVGSVSAILKEG